MKPCKFQKAMTKALQFMLKILPTCTIFCLKLLLPRGRVIRATFSCDLSCKKCCTASCGVILHKLSPRCAANFHVAKF